MNEPELDEYCRKIVAVLTLLQQDYRFNELHRFLNKHGTKISKVTLSQHLKHLIKLELVLRVQKDIQEVYYSVNFERFGTLKAASEATQETVKKFYQQERSFRAQPVSAKIDSYHVLTVLESLMLFKLELLAISEPERQFEHTLSHYVTVRHFMTIQDWLLEEFRKNPSGIENAKKELQNLVDRYMKTLFKTNSK
jgi:DNA-binding HxlR family transcriptional regulator